MADKLIPKWMVNNTLRKITEYTGVELVRVERDDHHLAHYGNEWLARKEAKYIRNQLIARQLARTAHNELHRYEGAVPVPQYHTLQRVAARMPQGLDIYSAIDSYCLLVDESSRHPNIKPIEIDLNNLSIEGMRRQIPYLREGLPNPRRIL